jgi:hypothetical protein
MSTLLLEKTMTDFRALCEELLDELQYQTSYDTNAELQDRARAALATPPPLPPTDEELRKLWLDLYATNDGPTSGEVVTIARAVLDKWGK